MAFVGSHELPFLNWALKPNITLHPTVEHQLFSLSQSSAGSLEHLMKNHNLSTNTPILLQTCIKINENIIEYRHFDFMTENSYCKLGNKTFIHLI